MQVVQHHTFRVTRNEDVEVEEDDAENLLLALEKDCSAARSAGRPYGWRSRTTLTPRCSSSLSGAGHPRAGGLPAPRSVGSDAACSRWPTSTGPS